MPPNIVSEAGLSTRVSQWWDGIPFFTSAVVIVCGTIYLFCLLTGYEKFYQICFLPFALISEFQVYRIYTSILFHGSLVHVMFNMLAFVPLGSELERIMGSIRMLYVIILLAASNAVFHLIIALLGAHNPIVPLQYLMDECAIGFSGIIFSLIVIETSLSEAQFRSVFGLFNVPAKWYPLVLLVLFQLVMPKVSLLGHLCGILSGFAYTHGLFNFLIPGTSFYSSIESSSWLSTCTRRPKFILCTGGNSSGYIPTYAGHNTNSSGLFSGTIWRNLYPWIPRRETYSQVSRRDYYELNLIWAMSLEMPSQDSRFPGRGRTLGYTQHIVNPNLEARLLDNNSHDHSLDTPSIGLGERLSNGRWINPSLRQLAVDDAVATGHQMPVSVISDEEIQQLVSMGFEKTQVEVALAAADGDVNVAVEILMSQQV